MTAKPWFTRCFLGLKHPGLVSIARQNGHFLAFLPFFERCGPGRAKHAMSLTLADVKRIANLAQLDMDEAHAGTALAELNGIFALAEQMQAVDTTGVEPLSQPLAAIMEMRLRLREDNVTEENQRADYQQPAPATQDGLYLVPKVIE
jgi:aspartyl-tRNA(Asn)/glutamyl-tRNA(Gln) amidotransferase subunit C